MFNWLNGTSTKKSFSKLEKGETMKTSKQDRIINALKDYIN